MKPQLFVFKGKQVRTVSINNEPYFVGRDVATILGYKKPQNAISKHVDNEDKKGAPIQGTPGGTQEMTVINESGLYSLILSSKMPQAHEFKRWVTSEVLPTIRKHGAYMTPETIEKALLNPDTIINLATQLKEEQEQRKKLEAENDVMKPKAIFADAISTSKTVVGVGELAKVLKQNGVDIGRNRLFDWLRDHKYLMQQGKDNVPTQRSMEMKLMEVKETLYGSPGNLHPRFTPKITGKGQQYFVNKFLNRKATEKV